MLSIRFNFNEGIETCSIISFINPLDSRNHSNEIFEDGYHPNVYGNELVYSDLKKSLKNN